SVLRAATHRPAMSTTSFSAVSRTSRGGSRSASTAAAICSASDADMGRDQPAERNTDGIGEHVENIERPVAGHALQELQSNSHGDEAQRVGRAHLPLGVNLAEKEHQQPIGCEMPELVTLGEVDRRWLGHERE